MNPETRKLPMREAVQRGFEPPRDNRGRIRWQVLKQEPVQLTAFIESESRLLISRGIQLKHKELMKAGVSYLSRAIVTYYPDGYSGLHQALGLSTKCKPRNYWARPEAIEIMKQDVEAIRQQEGRISEPLLRRVKRTDLIQAIRKHYPGGWQQLTADLEISSQQKPRGYWTKETIKKEADAFLSKNGVLSKSSLYQDGRCDLATAITGKYPGGLEALKTELQVNTRMKPHGYWNLNSIQVEAAQFYAEFGSLSPDTLVKNGRGDLLHAIFDRYPGGIKKLQNDQGIASRRKETGYWTVERIKEEALAFYNQHGKLTGPCLIAEGRGDLTNAFRDYPGGLRGLQKDLDIKTTKQPNGYWTVEKIEEEAAEFVKQHTTISFESLRRERKFSLHVMIGRLYPGGIAALKEKLGVSELPEATLSPDEANFELAKLIEEV